MATLLVRDGVMHSGHRYTATETQKNLSRVLPDITSRGKTKRNASSFDIEDEAARDELRPMGTAFMDKLWG